MNETLKVVLASGWGIYILALSVWLIMERRSPQATLGWLLALSGLPVVGFVIYYFFGPRRLKRHRMVRDASRQVLKSYRNYWHEQIEDALQFYPERKRPETASTNEREVYGDLVMRADDLDIPNVINQQARQLSRMVFDLTGLPISIASEYMLLGSGEQAFDAICDAIRAAQKTVHLEYYIYEPDATGTMFRDLLAQKAREGVKVRLLVDWLGSRRLTRNFMAPLLEAGGELAFFHQGSLRQVRPLLNMRTHRKIVVCDGVVGFTGGMNITDEQDKRRDKYAYHDLHLKLGGPVVFWLEQVFLEDWYYTTKEIPQDVPPPQEIESVPLAQMQQVQVIESGPDMPEAPIWRAKLMAINMARQRVWLATPYFAPDEPAVFALTSAALRGLDVRLLVPMMSDSWVTTMAARSWYEELLVAGVRIWLYGPRMLHSKTLLVDEAFSFVGTDNFDNRSFRLNFEVTVLNYEAQAAQALERQFKADMASALELTRAQTKAEPLWRQFVEGVARLAAPLL